MFKYSVKKKKIEFSFSSVNLFVLAFHLSINNQALVSYGFILVILYEFLFIFPQSVLFDQFGIIMVQPACSLTVASFGSSAARYLSVAMTTSVNRSQLSGAAAAGLSFCSSLPEQNGRAARLVFIMHPLVVIRGNDGSFALS